MQGVEDATKRPDSKKESIMTNRIAFQGALGAYSHEACRAAHPDMTPHPCHTFEDMISAVRSGEADLAMVPVENSTYGRVADIHRLLPDSGLHIVDEAFTRVRISLMAIPQVKLQDIKKVRAHMVLLPQARMFLEAHGIEPISAADSAGAASELAKTKDLTWGVLASELAAETYGLNILASNIEDHIHNTTRFLIMSQKADMAKRGTNKMMTTFVFQVRNIPAALFKAMGGFATNGVNMLKLESYMLGGSFTATQFYADVEGHPDDANVQRALEELDYFSTEIKILGVYPAHPHRP
jgi:prephenate dehydratase